MTSLILGIACVYLAFTVLRLPEERFRREWDQFTGRAHSERWYRLMRRLIWAVGIAGAAVIILRFF